MKAWTDIRQWVAEEDAWIRAKYDSITLYTGEEGRGKSYTMLARHKLADSRFNSDRVHFEQDDFMADAVGLPHGAAIQMDEFKGHRRQAMHSFRLEFLDFLKERRNLRLRIGIGYPQADQFEQDIFRKRVRYWAHKPSRRILEVHERVATTITLPNGDIDTVVRWPIRGRFIIPEPRGLLIQDYEEKKEAFTRRSPASPEEVYAPFIKDKAAAEEVLKEIRASVGR